MTRKNQGSRRLSNIPTTQRTVRQFLGLISYLRRYVKGFAFDALKWKLVEAPMPRS